MEDEEKRVVEEAKLEETEKRKIESLEVEIKPEEQKEFFY